MQIKSVELKNIKSHLASKFDFERGTTAITGTNGVGKTTILEAIAWTLFGFLDYKKDDFVTRGEKRGEVHVTVETSDLKTYIIYRDTGTGYYVFDPTIKAKIAEKGEEVSDFLRRILQVEVGTDLKELFQTAIGVPQGTFTADFLLSRELRKKKFDKLLKVEEYRNSAEKLKATIKHIELNRQVVFEKIIRAETQLERFEQLTDELKIFKEREKVLKKDLADLQTKLETTKKSLSEFEDLKQKADETLQKISHLEIQLNETNRRKNELEKQVEESKNASLKQKEVEADYLLFQTANETLKSLQVEQNKRINLQTDLTKTESEIKNCEIELKNLRENLEKSVSAKKEIENLANQLKNFAELDEKVKNSRTELANAKQANNRLQKLNTELSELREKFQKSKKEVEDFEVKFSETETKIKSLNLANTELEAIESQRNEITQQVANLKATIEKDKQFEVQVKNGLCPILSEKCLNIGENETLETYFKNAFSSNSNQINNLTEQQKNLENAFSLAKDLDKLQTSLENAKKFHDQITDEGKGKRAEQTELQQSLENLPKIEAENSALEKQFEEISKQKAKKDSLKNEAEKESIWKSKIAEVEEKQRTLEVKKMSVSKDLEAFANLDEKLKTANAEVEKTNSAQRIFLEFQGLANLLTQREISFAESTTEFEKLSTEIEIAKKDNAEILGKYNQTEHLSLQTEFDTLRRNEAISETELKQVSVNLKNCESEIERLKELKEKLKIEKAEENKLKKIGEATSFISDTLKKAAPEVAKMLLARISQEANLFFREITGNAERTLSWKEDYEISLEEYGYERPFSTLSGGEQMSASLSVRLAILQELSDIRFAFFDEPTVNMDAERREKLALAINGISQKLRFSQIFVISHDDTFESHTDYVVSVGK
jgi:DNA repair protein SbcC/Rad50